MKKAGIGLIALGFYCVLFAFNMDVVVGTTYNIGLMNERQNVVYLSGVIFLAGIILFGFGFSAKEESENFKQFAMACFLSPVLLLIGIKMITSVQELITKQSNIRRQAAIDTEKYASAKKAEAQKYARDKEAEAQKDAREREEKTNEQVEELEKKATVKKMLEENAKILKEYTDNFTNNKNSGNPKVSESLVTAAIAIHNVDYLYDCYFTGMKIENANQFSIAIYGVEGCGGGSNSYEIMAGFMKGKIIKPIMIGSRGDFSYKTIKIHKHSIELDGVTVGENDGYCCPSKPMTKKFEISENGFREITEKQ